MGDLSRGDSWGIMGALRPANGRVPRRLTPALGRLGCGFNYWVYFRLLPSFAHIRVHTRLLAGLIKYLVSSKLSLGFGRITYSVPHS